MTQNMRYCSVIRAQWNHIGFQAVHNIRNQQANENRTRMVEKKSEDTADQENLSLVSDEA